jgi:hypothetical protein
VKPAGKSRIDHSLFVEAAAMPTGYQLTVEEKPGYAHFRITGTNSPDAVRGYLEDVYQTSLQNKYSAILVEENLQGPSLRLFDIFAIICEGSARNLGQPRRIAYIDVNPAHSRADMAFAETTAVNRGMNMRLFATVSEAEQWLTRSNALQEPR